MLEKWPKDLQAVRCQNCQSAVAGLLDDCEKEDAEVVIQARRERAGTATDGLPVLTDEDREAVEEMRKLSNQMGNGRVGNRRRGSPSGRRKRRGQGGQGGGSGKKRYQQGNQQGNVKATLYTNKATIGQPEDNKKNAHIQTRWPSVSCLFFFNIQAYMYHFGLKLRFLVSGLVF